MLKKFLKDNVLTIIIVILMLGITMVIPSQIKVSLVAKSTISPRTFPYFASIGAIICCSLSLIFEAISAVRKSKKGEIAEPVKRDENVSYLRVIFCVGLLFIWYLTLKKVGFIISCIVVTFVLSYLLGNRNKLALILFPTIFSIVLYFVFSQLLHVNLPEILF